AHQARLGSSGSEGADDHPDDPDPLYREPAGRQSDRRVDQALQIRRDPRAHAGPADRRAHDRATGRDPKSTPMMGRYRRVVGWIRADRILLIDSGLPMPVLLAAFFFAQFMTQDQR